MIAMYPGSFDPITNGHVNIIKRASKLFDKLYVLVSVNPNKEYLFDLPSRLKLTSLALNEFKNVEVISSNGITIAEAKRLHVDTLIRGIRNDFDLAYEMEYYKINQSIDSSIDTVIMLADDNIKDISSTHIKELVMNDKSIDEFVPEVIKNTIIEKIKGKSI